VAPPSKDDVLKALKECYDPEIPVNIVDLGLIYLLEINEKGRVDLNMTLTAVGCPVADWMRETVAEKIRSLPGVTEAYVNIVFDPPWSPQKLSPEGKDLLTAMGFPV
jgi:metal-sulfur cluster biosynthetic enzyme